MPGGNNHKILRIAFHSTGNDCVEKIHIKKRFFEYIFIYRNSLRNDQKILMPAHSVQCNATRHASTDEPQRGRAGVDGTVQEFPE
jgi:hypothetical protein